MTVAEARAEYEQERERWKDEPWRQARVRDAYNRWFRLSCKSGRSPDSLDRHNPNETERFFARVIQGPDGHCYWDGSFHAGFQRNDGGRRNPRYWWWEHVHGLITDRSAVKPACGEPHCIYVGHQRLASWSEIQRFFTDEQCLGALQVAAMKLGHTPTLDQYDALHMRPSSTSIQLRFSSWSRAIQAAGLRSAPARQYEQQYTDDECIDALRAVHSAHGFVPSRSWWERTRQRPSPATIVRRFGGWTVALKRAGLKKAA